MEVMTMASSREISNFILEMFYEITTRSNSIMRGTFGIINLLELLADGNCDVYVGITENSINSSLSYMKAEDGAKKLFLVERGVGFDLIELEV